MGLSGVNKIAEISNVRDTIRAQLFLQGTAGVTAAQAPVLSQDKMTDIDDGSTSSEPDHGDDILYQDSEDEKPYPSSSEQHIAAYQRHVQAQQPSLPDKLMWAAAYSESSQMLVISREARGTRAEDWDIDEHASLFFRRKQCEAEAF